MLGHHRQTDMASELPRTTSDCWWCLVSNWTQTQFSWVKVVCVTFHIQYVKLCDQLKSAKNWHCWRYIAGTLNPSSSLPETHVVVTNPLISDENGSPDWMSCFMVYFLLNGSIIYEKTIRLYWRRLESRDYKLIRKLFSEVIHKVRSRHNAFCCKSTP